jgi:hypothetical protein
MATRQRVAGLQLHWRSLDVSKARGTPSFLPHVGDPALKERKTQASAARTNARRSSDASTFG